MSALRYLRHRKLKNQLFELVKKPARLIYVLFLVGCLALTLMGSATGLPGQAFRPAGELAAITAGLCFLIFLMTVNGGLTRGGSFFTLSDVNLLFPAPIRPQAILFHGLFQQASASLFIGFFLLFQYPNLSRLYGIGWGQMLFLIACYALTLFLGQVTAMLAYACTNREERLQKRGKAIFTAGVVGYALPVLAAAFAGGRGEALSRAAAVMGGPVLRWYPVAGWLEQAALGVLTGDVGTVLIGLALCAALLAVLIALIVRTDPDYYEDVLDSAELTHSALTAKKEGTMAETSPRNVRLGRVGLQRGWGASALFYKHRLENRRSRRFLLRTNALIFAVTVIFFSYFLREAGIVPTFCMAAYLQLFSAMLGRFTMELGRPYIYLIPESPMKKLLWALTESAPSALVESVAIFVPVGIILGLDVGTTLSCILARFSLAALYTAANVAVERMWGGGASRMLVLLLLLVTVLILLIPGVATVCILAFAAGIRSPSVLFLGLALGNFPCAALTLFLCRNVLQYAELNNL